MQQGPSVEDNEDCWIDLHDEKGDKPMKKFFKKIAVLLTVLPLLFCMAAIPAGAEAPTATAWHPSVATHDKAAQRLTETIREMMDWYE